MSDILFHYEKVNPTSWAYLSSLLMLALFFKFNRVFSVRNLDLFLLILLAPGLLLVQYSYENEGISENALQMQKLGFEWLFAVGGILMLRLLFDSAMVRRPLLEPNLNAAGLAFLGSSLLFFLMANVVTGSVTPADTRKRRGSRHVRHRGARLLAVVSAAADLDADGYLAIRGIAADYGRRAGATTAASRRSDGSRHGHSFPRNDRRRHGGHRRPALR
jgi:hypothetical protein